MINPGEYAAFARMDRALVAELGRRLRDENEHALARAQLEYDWLRLKADWDRLEGKNNVIL
jgi:hypothetical protein